MMQVVRLLGVEIISELEQDQRNKRKTYNLIECDLTHKPDPYTKHISLIEPAHYIFFKIL